MSLVLLFTGTSIISYIYNEFLQDFSAMVEEKVDSISEVTGHKVKNFLSPLEEVAKGCTFIFRALKSDDSFQVPQVILGFLRSYPQINGIVVALENGQGHIFSRLERTALNKYSVPEGAVKQEIIGSNLKSPLKQRAYFFDKKGQNIVFDEKGLELEEVHGDPRKMKWYTETKGSGKLLHKLSALLYNESIGLSR